MANLPRNRLMNYKYTTGDSQEYTKEYTWEDWVAASMTMERNPGTTRGDIVAAIYNFFKENPEKLLEGGPAKENNVTVEQLRIWFQGGVMPPVWWL